jgi:hypothetical protein
MNQTEELTAWRLFRCNWIVLGAMALALALALALSRFSLKPAGALLPLGIAVTYLSVAYYKASRLRGGDPMIAFILASTGQVLLIPLLMTPMTYIAASADLPLQDATLAGLDRALGLDWHAYFALMSKYHIVVVSSVLGYSMIGWPLFGVPVVLGLSRRYRRLQEFTLAFALALIATTVITALVPAIGVYDAHAFTRSDPVFSSEAYLEHLRDFPHVRDGTLRTLDLINLTGIVTFPSFHAAAAIVYLWSFWAVWWMRPIALLANGGMLLATPFIGGHYFVDVFAGIAIAAAAIMAARWITDRLSRPVKAKTAYLPESAVPAE